ncbi:hypothetical protein ACQ4PT_067147 [Festuca glaucescens]
MCKGPRRCLNCKSEDHVARKCPEVVAPVAGEVALGAPPPPRGGPPTTSAPVAAAAGPRSAPGAQGELYRVPARQRLGPREGSPPPPPYPALQGRMGDRGAAPMVERQDAGPSASHGIVDEARETPFERGLRLEREIHAAPPLQPEERAQGLSFYDRESRREQELRAAALSSVAGPSAMERHLSPEVAEDVEAAWPASERGIIYRTPEVESTERALRWGLVAFVSGTRRTVSYAAASVAIVERFLELEGHFSVHGYWPADLLLVFDSRANRGIVLTAAANPFEGRDFVLRFGVWNHQLQATRRCFRFRVHLEVVGVPPIAWNLDTARWILGSYGWVERLGSETASRADLGTFCITAWTDNLSGLPRTKQLWLAEPLVFDDDDLLLPVEALIPEEVALLYYDATVHIVHVEDTEGAVGRSFPGGGPGPRPGGDRGGQGNGGGRGPPTDDRRRPPNARAGGASAAAPACRWRGGAERRVALGHTASVRLWPPIVELGVAAPHVPVVVAVQCAPAPFRTYSKGLARSSGLDAALTVELPKPAAKDFDTKVDGSAFDFFRQGLATPSLGGRGGFASSASIQSGNPKEWVVIDEALSPTGPLSPTGSVGLLDSWRTNDERFQGSPLSMFTVELTSAPS